MKKIYNIILAAGFGLMAASCSDFIEVEPTGVISDEIAYSSPEEMVTAAYSGLGDDWYNYPFNLWPYGDVSSDDCFKGGSGVSDTNLHHVEIWTTLTSSTPDHLDELWYRLYCQVSRCNRAIVSLDRYGEEKLGAELAAQRKAEVRFLRGHFYFKLLQLFYQIPWIDENTLINDTFEQTRNDEFTYEENMQKIIEDFEAGYKILPEKNEEAGRVNKIACASYLAKCYLTLAYGNGYEATNGVSHLNKDYLQKVVEYCKVVDDSDYKLISEYGALFLPEYKNCGESIFAVQHSDYKDDNTTYGRANWSNMLNGCWGMWSCGWDFHKPSQNLVNAFKTKDGLPMFDDYDKDHNTYPVKGVASSQKYDPRLFHTVGMPSWPYKYEEDRIQTKDNSRNPSTYGYYTSIKEVPQRGDGETFNGSWQAFAMNDYIFRVADVMLMEAEALVELGGQSNLNTARDIVNKIRNRASHSYNYTGYAHDYCEIALYPDSYFQSQEKARQCVRWERRLELAMENQRFFDLRRWGIASETLNAYFKSEVKDNYDGQEYAQYLNDAHFTPDKNEYWPLPYNQMYYVPGLYVQNKNYN